MPAPSDTSLAPQRAVMDAALSAPNGARVVFPDADYGDKDDALREARAWRTKCLNVRANQRRMQLRHARTQANEDAAARGASLDLASLERADHSAMRTSYDALAITVDRAASNDGWTLTILKVDIASLSVTVETF